MKAELMLAKFILALIIIFIIVCLIDLNIHSLPNSFIPSGNRTIERRRIFNRPITDLSNNLIKTVNTQPYTNQTILYASLNLTTQNLELSDSLCDSNDESKILIGLMSKNDAFERRQIIRETLGMQIRSLNQKLLFFVAESLNETVNELLADEFILNQDLVQLEFVENYYNLTLKSISLVQYFNSYCEKFKYLIKLDDDVFFNWQSVYKFLIGEQKNAEPTIYCKVHKKPPVVRDINDKYYVEESVYSSKFYPDYCGGPFYILNKEAARRIVEQHEKVKKNVFTMEDVYITGMCTTGTDTKLVNMVNTFRPSRVNLWKLMSYYLSSKIFALHPITSSEYKTMYSEIEQKYSLIM